MPEKRNSVKLAEIESSLPGFGEAAESALLLRAAMFDTVTEADIGAIVKAQVDKAKAGDARAAKFVLDMIAAAAPRTTLNVGIRANQAGQQPGNNGSPAAPLRVIKPPKGDPEFDKADETPRLEAARLLLKHGPLAVVEIAKRLSYPAETITRAIGKDPNGWFALHAGKYGITGQGREAVAG